jgi:hypothetical protein
MVEFGEVMEWMKDWAFTAWRLWLYILAIRSPPLFAFILGEQKVV